MMKNRVDDNLSWLLLLILSLQIQLWPCHGIHNRNWNLHSLVAFQRIPQWSNRNTRKSLTTTTLTGSMLRIGEDISGNIKPLIVTQPDSPPQATADDSWIQKNFEETEPLDMKLVSVLLEVRDTLKHNWRQLQQFHKHSTMARAIPPAPPMDTLPDDLATNNPYLKHGENPVQQPPEESSVSSTISSYTCSTEETVLQQIEEMKQSWRTLVSIAQALDQTGHNQHDDILVQDLYKLRESCLQMERDIYDNAFIPPVYKPTMEHAKAWNQVDDNMMDGDAKILSVLHEIKDNFQRMADAGVTFGPQDSSAQEQETQPPTATATSLKNDPSTPSTFYTAAGFSAQTQQQESKAEPTMQTPQEPKVDPSLPDAPVAAATPQPVQVERQSQQQQTQQTQKEPSKQFIAAWTTFEDTRDDYQTQILSELAEIKRSWAALAKEDAEYIDSALQSVGGISGLDRWAMQSPLTTTESAPPAMAAATASETTKVTDTTTTRDDATTVPQLIPDTMPGELANRIVRPVTTPPPVAAMDSASSAVLPVQPSVDNTGGTPQHHQPRMEDLIFDPGNLLRLRDEEVGGVSNEEEEDYLSDDEEDEDDDDEDDDDQAYSSIASFLVSSAIGVALPFQLYHSSLPATLPADTFVGPTDDDTPMLTTKGEARGLLETLSDRAKRGAPAARAILEGLSEDAGNIQLPDNIDEPVLLRTQQELFEESIRGASRQAENIWNKFTAKARESQMLWGKVAGSFQRTPTVPVDEPLLGGQLGAELEQAPALADLLGDSPWMSTLESEEDAFPSSLGKYLDSTVANEQVEFPSTTLPELSSLPESTTSEGDSPGALDSSPAS